ncbi:MAG TPA: amidohydrolase family protein [Acidimicrobiales bacterium]|nr:amidohydrolase family protein [Acidimicrobiales bacterium]
MPGETYTDARYMVVSVDAHVGPPTEAFAEYCPAKYRDDFDLAVRRAKEAMGPPGRTFETIAKKALGLKSVDPALLAAAERANLVAGQWDPDARRADMDADGVSADVIFHGTQNGEQLPFVADALFVTSSGGNSELEAVGCRMYNRWLVDFVSGCPERHAGLAYVPWSDIDAAVEELAWAREAGLRGVNFPSPNQKRPYYYDPGYERFWAAAADLEMPLTTHAAGGDRWDYEDGVLGQAFQIMELGFLARRSIWQLTFSGVFERHPKLKYVLTEARATWVNEVIRDMDYAYTDTVNPALRERLPRLPSEYWMTHCFIGGSFLSHDEAALYPDRGAANIMWGSDYPHLEGTFPYTLPSLQATFAGIRPDYVRPMIGLTAAKVYGLDVDYLNRLAAQIGPTEKQLSQPPSDRPGPEYVGRGFRESSSWPADAYPGAEATAAAS